MVDLSIIIVSYNTDSFLRECLSALHDRLKDEKEINAEIIVVDNASSDGSVQTVKEHFPKTILIENTANYGFSKANNIGIKKAKGEYLLFLNSDAIFIKQTEKHPLHYLLAFMQEHPTVGAVTCRVSLPSGEIDDACHRGFPTPWNSFCHFSGLGSLFPHSAWLNGYHLGYGSMDQTHEIDALAGAFMLVRRKAGEKLSWWDEDYFFYGEDLDFCYKLKKDGWKIFYIPHISVAHYKGVSSGIKEASKHVSRATAEERKKITYARFDAMKIFYRKHYTTLYPKFVMWLVMKGIDAKMKMTMRSI
jgi:GT2 family glycosyltransferase